MVTRQTCLAVFGVLFLRSIAVAQTSDITPPTLASLTFNSTVDVTTASQNVPITAHVMDDLSGVSFVQVLFESPVFGAGQVQFQFVFFSPVSNATPFTNGNLQSSLQMPRYSENGAWTIVSVFLKDNAGNSRTLNRSDLQAAGIPTTLNVTSIPDTTPPQVTNISLSSSSIDVSSASQPLTVTLTVTDDVSGADMNHFFEVMELVSPSGNQSLFFVDGDFSLVSGTNLNGAWQATHSIPRFSEAGTWTIGFIQFQDNAANYRFLNTSQLSALGLTTTFTVVSSRSDTTPPTITGFDFTPKLFDTSSGPQTVTVTFNVTDDLSGADLSAADRFCAGVQFVSPSGGQTNFSCFLQLTAGTPLNGTWQGSVFFPQYEESGTWKANIFRVKDAANNLLSLSTTQMAALNFPVELAIFKPTVVATIGPNGGTVMDPAFGSKAEITIPPGLIPQGQSVTVATQVLTNPLTDVPTPLGFSTGPGTLFVDFTINPPINNDPFFVVPPPGVTLVLPLAHAMTPGSSINLWRFDPTTKMLVAVPNAITGAPVVGTVNADGLSATFLNVGHLSIFVGLIPRDKTPPVIVPHISGTPGSNGWYRTNVTVTWDVSDPESNIYSSTGCGLTKLTSDTAGITLTCSATNFAGLSNSAQVTIKIDQTPPVINGMPAASCSLWPPDHKLVQVAFVTASDALSGLDKNLFRVTGTSNEAPNPGEQDVVITPLGFTGPTTNGAPGYIVQLRADRSGNGNGRIYTITAMATDLAGNSSTATATCVVPHDQGKGK